MQNNFRKFEELVFCDLWFPDSGFRFPVSGFRFPDSGFRMPVSDSGFWFPIPDSGFRFPGFRVALENAFSGQNTLLPINSLPSDP